MIIRLRRLVVLIFMIGVTACSTSDLPHDPAETEKERIVNAILHKVARQLKEEIALCPIGTIGQMHYDVEKLGLSFYYYKSIDIVEGRKLLVQAIRAMLKEINQEKRIHHYLCRYPFLPQNVEIRIILRSPNGRDVPPGSLWGVVANDGILCYKIDHPQKEGLTTIYKETFNEAMERLADPSLPLVPFGLDQEIGQEELRRLRKGIIFVSDDGSIWHLGENGAWVADSKFVGSKE